jgi:hypothetical protein
MEFMPYDSNFLFGPGVTEVIVSLRMETHCHQQDRTSALDNPTKDLPEFGSPSLAATSSLVTGIPFP